MGNQTERLNETDDHVPLSTVVFRLGEEHLYEAIVKGNIGKVEALLQEVVGFAERVDEEEVRLRELEVFNIVLLHHLREYERRDD